MEIHVLLMEIPVSVLIVFCDQVVSFNPSLLL